MDVGALVLLLNMPDEFDKARQLSREQMKPLWEAERDVLGVSHAEVGAYLLSLWGLSDTIDEAILHHHLPTRSNNLQFSALTCIHVANALEHDHRIDEPTFNVPKIDEGYMSSIQMLPRLGAWREAVLGLRRQRA
jgi:HD-like signal output (HDOD) protein